jgi:hypothetical protein
MVEVKKKLFVEEGLPVPAHICRSSSILILERFRMTSLELEVTIGELCRTFFWILRILSAGNRP